MEACPVTDLASMNSGRRWADEALAHHRAVGFLECSEAGIVSVAADARTAREGHAARARIDLATLLHDGATTSGFLDTVDNIFS